VDAPNTSGGAVPVTLTSGAGERERERERQTERERDLLVLLANRIWLAGHIKAKGKGDRDRK